MLCASQMLLLNKLMDKPAGQFSSYVNGIHYDQPSGSLGQGNGTPLQYSCLENPMDRGAWWAAVHGVTEGRTRLSDFTFTFHFHALEKEMATHSSVLAWRIPGTGEPGGLPSVESHRVGYDWSDLAAAAAVTLSRHLSKSYHCFRATMFSPAVFCPQLEWMVKSEWVTCLNRKCSWVTPPSGPGVNILTLFDP